MDTSVFTDEIPIEQVIAGKDRNLNLIMRPETMMEKIIRIIREAH